MEEIPKTHKSALVTSRKQVGKVTEVPLAQPKRNQVVVKIAYAPVNPSDVGTLENWYPVQAKPPHSVGFEASGEVVAVGENLRVPHKVGDRVHVIGLGTWSQYIVLPSEACFKMREGLSLEQAACHYVNPGTVVYMAKLAERGGHKAAIHTAGASSLGKMMIPYFKEKGIKLINIVRREEYVQKLLNEGADYVLNSEAPDFTSQLRTIAAKEKATICFEAIAGDFTGRILRAMPSSSSIYVYGALSGKNVGGITVNDIAFLDKKVTGLWLQTYFKEVVAQGKTTEFFNEIHSRLNTIFESKIQKIFTLEDLEAAIAYYKENSSKGKILIKPNL